MGKLMREPFNTVSHLAGALLVVVGAVWLIARSWGDVPTTAAFAIYGVCNALLFLASAVYHWTKEPKLGLQKLDHSAIYLMIAGTYTPVCLISIAGKLGWVALAVQWTLAIVGIVLTFALQKVPTPVRLVLYLVMGWMALPLVGPMSRAVPWSAIGWLIAGGLAYTVGTVVYATQRPRLWPGKFSSHELWHVFVLGGAACHFVLMAFLLR